MALSVGIVGLPGSGKTTLFNALTGAGASEYGKEHVGMATMADERLDQVSAVIGSAKTTPAAIRVVDVPGTGVQLLGNLRQADAVLAVLDGYSANADPARDLETIKLELQVADRDHVERRLERVRKEAKSGDPAKKAEAARLEELLAHVEAGGSLADEGDLPPELEPLTTKPLIPIVNGPQGLDAQLELELAELPEEDAAAFRDGKPSALADVAARLADALQRLEGKSYVVSDGDVLNVRFNI